MKNLINLIDLMNDVQKNEIEKCYLVKASVDFKTIYYPKDDKKLIHFTYTLLTEKTKDRKVDFIFDIDEVSTEEIQKMYYTLLCDCRIK